MAGSAAIALLVLGTIRESSLGLLYLLCFGAGTVAGMVGVTAMLVLPLSTLVTRAGVSRRWLTLASGVASVVFGLFLAQSLGGPAALFAADPVFMAR
jgi:high-affinity nickel-transport protein